MMTASNFSNTDHSSYLEGLNPEQREAVENLDGPLLILAGAGTGKTKVLTTRIAHLLFNKRAFPSQILAVTFTNKASREMKSRMESLLGYEVDGLMLGTFHSIAAKVLRRHAELVGLTSSFTIIDYDDQLRLAKQILNDYNVDDKKNPPKVLVYLINHFKDKALAPDKVESYDNSYFADGKLPSLYAEYQRRLKLLNSADFGDLTLYNIEIFNTHLDVLEYYQNRFKYILVDEYQDTNVAQYLWLRLLAQKQRNICCVGDDDQSIYGWRGAEVTNILRFDKDFEGAKIVRLERNYRSKGHILNAASHIISNNKNRHDKTLWTEDDDGQKIKLNSLYDDREEARFIAEEIESLRRLRKLRYSDMAILVRAGYQTRSFEESLNAYRIPYHIIGGIKFYERMEIRDVIAYIRLLVNRGDSLAFERIINTPKRGIGGTTIQKIRMFANEEQISMAAAAQKLISMRQIKGKGADSIMALLNNFDKWDKLLSETTHYDVTDMMLAESGYIQMWKDEKTEESRDRVDNIYELLRSLEEFPDLKTYLEHVSLINDIDNMQDDDRVNVMTMHAAKGLEFETVFLAGWEEGVFPSQKALDENGKSGLEEERRLAYVAITRAKNNLYISFTSTRRMYGSFQASTPSRFIDELPKESYELLNAPSSYTRYKNLNSQQHYQKPKSPVISNKPDAKFKVSQKVTHPKFGSGRIINIAGDIAEVVFAESGIKKVMIDYLN
ncbi:MAG: ATP-dependent helicase [Alphaproteobacteria bacterium]|jgi:DNA helicase-2/ATP-dependent DNA helicase PcrA